MITKTVVMMAAVKLFLVFLLVVGDLKVSCFLSGEFERLKALSRQGLQGHLQTSGSSRDSPATTTVMTQSPTDTQATSVVATDKFTLADSDDNLNRFCSDCKRNCRHGRCIPIFCPIYLCSLLSDISSV
ncbi:hypothetical protein UPYG_G00349700 [Umbra pygmaea]|uniref:Uncharacterized protein n=1 Tax=Umbra pygmaea TaxID=75934 RepID=A0ABD0WCP0_UMBPY